MAAALAPLQLEGMPPTPQVREQLNRPKWKFTNMALGPEGVSSLVCVTQAAQQLTHLDLSNSMTDDLPCAMLVSQLDLQRVPLAASQPTSAPGPWPQTTD